jgi:hypothetical protein
MGPGLDLWFCHYTFLNNYVFIFRPYFSHMQKKNGDTRLQVPKAYFEELSDSIKMLPRA